MHERPDQGGLGKSWLCGRGLERRQLRQSLFSVGDSRLYHLLKIDDGLLPEPKVVHGPMERWCPWR